MIRLGIAFIKSQFIFLLIFSTSLSFAATYRSSQTRISVIAPIGNGEGPNRVPVFVASGSVGRTILSCDDGRTWIRDRSDNDAVQCGDALDCGHHTGAPHGLVYGAGWFFANYGWGAPGTVRRTRDGYNWQTVANTQLGGGGLAYFTDNLLWVAHSVFSTSSNLGVSFTNITSSVGYLLSRNVTSTGSIAIVTGDDAVIAKISRDNARTWANFSIANVDLSGRNLQIVSGNGVIVGISSVSSYNSTTGIGTNIAHISRSTDNGLTWTGTQVQSSPNYFIWSTLIFDGTRFITWLNRQMWTSTNGISWTQTNIATPGANDITLDRSVARSPTGTFVAIPNNFGYSYNQQAAFRSTDGITWTRLSTTSFTGGHPISEIVPGYVDTAACQ